jgi:TIR domain
MAVKIFFSYAHEDELLLNELKTHLEALKRQGLIDMWYDRNISAGTEWAKEIDTHLDTSQIILLLVSHRECAFL